MVPNSSWKFIAYFIVVGFAINSIPSRCSAQNAADNNSGTSTLQENGQSLTSDQLGTFFQSDDTGASTDNPVDTFGSYETNSSDDANSLKVGSVSKSSIVAKQDFITPPNGNTQGQSVVSNQDALANIAANDNLLTGNLYFSIDFMFLQRTGPSPQILAVTDGVPSLNSADFTYNAEFAPRVTLGLGDQFGYGFEFNYFKSKHQFNGVLAGTSVTPIFFNGIPATPVQSYTVFAESQTDNYELNQWVRLNGRSRIGLGLRIIDMREEYNITESGTNSGFFCITDNELFGGQVAGQFIFLSNDIARVYFQGKVGMFYNKAVVKATSQNAQITPDSDEFSIAGDLRLIADVPLTQIFSFRFGYHASYMTQIAQALDQNDDLTIFNPVDPGDFDFSTVWFRGGFFGLVGSY